MKLLNRVGVLCAVVAVCVFYANDLVAQPHVGQGIPFYFNFIPNYRNMSLDFENVTATNVHPTVNEQTSNEKEVEFGDYDNDGDLDVVLAVALSDFGERRNKLYRNDSGDMNEVTTSVIPGFSSSDVARSVFFRDFDKDGWLDIIVVCDSNSLGQNPPAESPGRTKFYRNIKGTSFVNESLARIQINGMGAACNGTAEDFDQDGYCDFLSCNYPNQSQDTLNVNQGAADPGVFVNMTSTLFPAESGYGVHSEAADMNGDGKLDILVGNNSGNNWIYYNDNNGAGEHVGDFRYGGAGASTAFSRSAAGEVVLVPGDFNRDGLMDFYFSNKGGSSGSEIDVIMVNTGNDGNNKAMFPANNIVEMPAIHNNETVKVTVNDLDGDGFDDLIIMAENRRPYVYRNTSVAGGAVSFVQWSPATDFPAGTLLSGWHAKSAQILGSDRPDIFVGAYNDDFLFENLKPTEYLESALGGVLPNFHNTDPIAVLGTASTGQTEVFTRTIAAGATVSVILRSAGDVSLEVRQPNGTLIASSEKGFVHTAEAVQFVAPGGSLEFRVIMNRVIYDGDGDGDIDAADSVLMMQCIADNDFMEDCLVFDLSNSYGVTAFDAILFRQRMTSGQAEEFYCLELLSRTN